MLPAKHIAQAQGAANPDEVAWQAGLLACIGSGMIEFLGCFVAERIRKMTPRAALLASLSGAGIAFLTLNFLFSTFAHPVVGLATLGLVFVFYFGGLKPKWGIPAALVILTVGVVLSWLTGIAPVGTAPTASLGAHLPVLVIRDVWLGMKSGLLLPPLTVSVIVPMGLLESPRLPSMPRVCSRSRGFVLNPLLPCRKWTGNSRSSLFRLALSHVHLHRTSGSGSEWARRSGYSTLNGIFITAICLTGSMATLAWAVPADAGLAIIVWIGITITVQAFEVTPQRHWPAVVVGMLPVIMAWATFSIKNGLRIGGYGTVAGMTFSPGLIQAFHASGTFIDGGFVYNT